MKIMKAGACGLALLVIVGWMLAGGKTSFPELTAVAFQQDNAVQGEASAEESSRPSVFLHRRPLRVLRDTYPTYSAVAVDTNSNEVYLQDENLIGLMVYDRLADTPPTATMTEPKRVIPAGKQTKINYNCSLYIDPKSGDVYTVSNESTDTMTVWPRGAEGNVEPMRELHTTHPSFGIAVDEEAQELFLANQRPSAVLVYRKMASGREAPIRILEGPSTGLADPHGIVVDTKNQLMFVSNHGADTAAKDGIYFTKALPDILREGGQQNPLAPITWQPNLTEETGLIKGAGSFEPPSIRVYPLKAKGNTPPLRVITGPKTQLNWPALMALNPEQDELFVANDTGHSILVFSTTSSGNIEPKRVLKGPKTGIRNPTGVFVDLQNRELWVSNMGNHMATVYPLSANGDTAPLRTIRSAPLGQPAMMIGNPGSVAFDSKRDEILVPN